MAQLTPEQEAFLKLRFPEAYAPVREPVVYIRDWLAIKKMVNAAPEPESARLELVGLVEPFYGALIADMQHTVRKACEAITLDPECAEAFVLVSNAVIQLSRFGEDVIHPQPLREVLPLAQRAKQLADDSAQAWAALIELNIHLRRWDTVTEQLAQFRQRRFDALLSAQLGLLAAKGQELPQDEVLWYDKLLALSQTSAERAELHGKQAMAYLKLKQIKEADAAFHRAMVEGGEISWVAHEWSMLKDEMGNRPAAIELNRRAIIFENDNNAAKVFSEVLRAPFRRFGRTMPGPAVLDEEKVRGIALAGCDPAAQAAAKLKPYERPKSVTRMMTKRQLKKMETKAKGPSDLRTGEGGIPLARVLTPEESEQQEETTGVGSGYLQQVGDSVTLRNIEKEKVKEREDDSGLLVPRNIEAPVPMPSTRTIRREDVQPEKPADKPGTRIVRRPPPVPMGLAAPTPAIRPEEPEPPVADANAPPKSGSYVRPPIGAIKRPATDQSPGVRPSTGSVQALPNKPSTGSVQALPNKPSTGSVPALVKKPPTSEVPALAKKPPTGEVPAMPLHVKPPTGETRLLSSPPRKPATAPRLALPIPVPQSSLALPPAQAAPLAAPETPKAEPVAGDTQKLPAQDANTEAETRKVVPKSEPIVEPATDVVVDLNAPPPAAKNPPEQS